MNATWIAIGRIVGVIVMTALIWLGAQLVAFSLDWPTFETGKIGPTPLSAMLVLISFAGLAGGVLFAARLLHGWGPGEMIGPPGSLKRLAPRALLIAGSAMLLTTGFGLWMSELPEARPIVPWLTFLPAAIAGVALQTFAEELAFRGYLFRALQAPLMGPIGAAILSSIFFAALHFNLQATVGANAVTIALILIFSLCLTDLTWRSGSIIPAWIMHFCNNLVGIVIISVDGRLSGLSLWVAPATLATEVNPVSSLLDLAVILAVWYLIRRGLTRPV